MFGGDKSREFQKAMDPESIRRDREDNRLSLRKQKREEALKRKRRQIMSNDEKQDMNSSDNQLASTSGINISAINVKDLSSYISKMKSNQKDVKIYGTMCIRILLSKANESPPYKSIIDSGAVPILLSFIKCPNNKIQKLQFEAAWSITNLCSATSEIVEYLCQSDAIHAFNDLLQKTQCIEIMEQCIWGLGNIAGESQKYRNIILKSGIFDFLLKRAEYFLFEHKQWSLCRNILWCIGNLLRYDGIGSMKNYKQTQEGPSDLCPWDNIKSMLGIFEKLLNEIGSKLKEKKIAINNGALKEDDGDYQICLGLASDALWSLQYSQIYMELCPKCSYISDFFQTNIIDSVIKFMQMDSALCLAPSLRIVGTFVSGDDFIAEIMIKRGFLAAAMLNLHCKVRMLRKEVCWALSNIAGCEQNIAVQIIEFSDGQLLKTLINTCMFDDDSIKKEAAWVLANLISLSDPQIIHHLVEKGVIKALRAVMKTSSVKRPLVTCMESFDIIMSHTKARDNGPYDYISKVEESGVCDIFDILQAGIDENDIVFSTSYELCQKYWPAEHEESTHRWLPQKAQSNEEEDDEDDDIKEIKPQGLEQATRMTNGQFEFGIHPNVTQMDADKPFDF